MIDDAQIESTAAVDRLGGEHHIEREFCSDQSRKPLGAPRSWQQTKLDFRETEGR